MMIMPVLINLINLSYYAIMALPFFSVNTYIFNYFNSKKKYIKPLLVNLFNVILLVVLNGIFNSNITEIFNNFIVSLIITSIIYIIIYFKENKLRYEFKMKRNIIAYLILSLNILFLYNFTT